VCWSLAACRSQLVHARAALDWQRRERHRLTRQLRRRWAPTARYAIRLAARSYSVNESAMLRVASCESGLDPLATNGRYAGLFQLGAPFMSHTPFATFSRFDPLANALAAASVVRVEGWRQWECQP